MTVLTTSSEERDKTTLTDVVYGELIELLALGGGPEAILAFRSSETVQNRAYELLYKKREGNLTAEEDRELTAFTEREHIVRMAKIRARLLMQKQVA